MSSAECLSRYFDDKGRVRENEEASAVKQVVRKEGLLKVTC